MESQERAFKVGCHEERSRAVKKRQDLGQILGAGLNVSLRNVDSHKRSLFILPGGSEKTS